MSTEQALRAALTEMIAWIGECTCHEGYTSRKLKDPDCRYHDNLPEITQARSALDLPSPEVTLEYRVVYEAEDYCGQWAEKIRPCGKHSADDIAADPRKEYPWGCRNSRIESREVAAGPWLPVVQP